jgi:transposase
MRPRGDPRALERRRLEAIKLFKEGIRPGRIAVRLGVDRRSVHRWLAAYRSRGIEGIAPMPTLGRPCKLSVVDRQKLSRILLGGATICGYPSDRWTNPRIADLIEHHFGVTYHVNHIGRLFQKLESKA